MTVNVTIQRVNKMKGQTVKSNKLGVIDCGVKSIKDILEPLLNEDVTVYTADGTIYFISRFHNWQIIKINGRYTIHLFGDESKIRLFERNGFGIGSYGGTKYYWIDCFNMKVCAYIYYTRDRLATVVSKRKQNEAGIC